MSSSQGLAKDLREAPWPVLSHGEESTTEDEGLGVDSVNQNVAAPSDYNISRYPTTVRL